MDDEIAFARNDNECSSKNLYCTCADTVALLSKGEAWPLLVNLLSTGAEDITTDEGGL
jgi:hypothetical protein